jgi:ribonuclease P protein component
LLRPADFERVMAQGRRRRGQSFTAIELAGAAPGARLGLAVSKKSLRRAVDRNRFKRIVRESFRAALDLPVCDVVILATPAARSTEGAALAIELDDYWKRLSQRWPRS